MLLSRCFSLRYALLLGAACAMQLLASHSQIFYATFSMALFYISIVAIGRAIEKNSARPLARAAILLGLAAILTICLSAILQRLCFRLKPALQPPAALHKFSRSFSRAPLRKAHPGAKR